MASTTVALPSDAEEAVAELREQMLAVRDYIRALEDSGPAGENSPKVTQLNETIRQRMATLRKLLEELELLADEQDRDEDRDLVMVEVKRQQAEHDGLQAAIRDARLEVRKKALAAVEDERRMLWSGQEEEVKRRKLESEAEMVSAAEEATDILRRTRQMMAQELDHTGATAAALRESTATLKKTEGELQSQQQSLGLAKRLLTFLSKQEVVDRLVTIGSFVMFLLVVAHIILKRTPVLAHLHPYNWALVESSAAGAAPPVDAEL